MLARRESQRGFTLVELLVAISLIVVLVTAMIFAANALRERSRKISTRSLLDRVSLSLEEYHRKYNKYPEDPSVGAAYQPDQRKFWVKRLLARTNLSLSENEWKDNKLLDAWGNEIRYKRLSEPSGFVLHSNGPDETSGTSDDIEVRK